MARVGRGLPQDIEDLFRAAIEDHLPPKVKLNKYNITDAQRSWFETYHTSNNDACNPYCQLETCSEFGLLHDATSHWVTQINTVFLWVVSDDGDIFKVPYSMKKVYGGFNRGKYLWRASNGDRLNQNSAR